MGAIRLGNVYLWKCVYFSLLTSAPWSPQRATGLSDHLFHTGSRFHSWSVPPDTPQWVHRVADHPKHQHSSSHQTVQRLQCFLNETANKQSNKRTAKNIIFPNAKVDCDLRWSFSTLPMLQPIDTVLPLVVTPPIIKLLPLLPPN